MTSLTLTASSCLSQFGALGNCKGEVSLMLLITTSVEMRCTHHRECCIFSQWVSRSGMSSPLHPDKRKRKGRAALDVALMLKWAKGVERLKFGAWRRTGPGRLRIVLRKAEMPKKRGAGLGYQKSSRGCLLQVREVGDLRQEEILGRMW